MATLMERDVIAEYIASVEAKSIRIQIMMETLGIKNEEYFNSLKQDDLILFNLKQNYMSKELTDLDFNDAIAEIKIFDNKYSVAKNALDTIRML